MSPVKVTWSCLGVPSALLHIQQLKALVLLVAGVGVLKIALEEIGWENVVFSIQTTFILSITNFYSLVYTINILIDSRCSERFIRCETRCKTL